MPLGLIWTSISSISISPTLGWKNVFGKCCWKVSGGTTILTSHTCIDLTTTSNETSGLNLSSVSLLTCPIIFKPVDVINLTSWSNQTNVGIVIIPIESSHGYVANIKSFSLSNIPKLKS